MLLPTFISEPGGNMSTFDFSDYLHRGVKLAMDTGEVSSIAEAQELFAGYQLCIQCGLDIAESSTLQAILLTAVNTARRCFLGGVFVVIDPSLPLKLHWKNCQTIGEAIKDLQGEIVTAVKSPMPCITIGDVGAGGSGPFSLRATFDGWLAGVTPLEDNQRLPESQEFTPSGILAGALAVSEAFQHVRGNVEAGYRNVGMSLWQPSPDISWLNASAGPTLELLPTNLWVIGLGHLGQAFLWTLGFLPYPDPNEVCIVLHDFDAITPANESTSLLTNHGNIGQNKTRAMANWCDNRGFRNVIIERPFANNFRITDTDPQVALCGVDNAHARAALETVGFHWILEAGLGWGTEEYLALQMHTFPANRTAQERWAGNRGISKADTVGKPAYQALAYKDIDACGLTQLAERTVGVPFVGAATSAIVIAELLRMLTGGQRHEVIDASLSALHNRQVVPYQQKDEPFNPGVVSI